MSEGEITLLLKDMIEAAQKILFYTDTMSFEDFIEDDKTKDAVIRNFEVIGEAAKRVHDDFKRRHPEIEWKRIRGFRNRIVHEYFGIDFEMVWQIKEENLDELIAKLSSLHEAK